MPETSQHGFSGLSPVTAELVGEIARLTMALTTTTQQLRDAVAENARLRAALAAPPAARED